MYGYIIEPCENKIIKKEQIVEGRDDQGRPLTKRGPDGKPPINRRLQVRQWGSNIIQKVRSNTCAVYYILDI